MAKKKINEENMENIAGGVDNFIGGPTGTRYGDAKKGSHIGGQGGVNPGAETGSGMYEGPDGKMHHAGTRIFEPEDK